MRRWWLPLVAAVAVAALLGGVWWVAGSGSSSSGSSSGSSSAGGGFAGGSDGGGSAGFTGTPDLPIDSGTPEPTIGPPTIEPGADGWPRSDAPFAVRIDGYTVSDGGRLLTLSYTTGLPQCYGKVGRPEARETAVDVTVTLTRIPPKPDPDVACIDIAVVKSVKVLLDAPLGDRVVRDGSARGTVVPPGGGTR